MLLLKLVPAVWGGVDDSSRIARNQYIPNIFANGTLPHHTWGRGNVRPRYIRDIAGVEVFASTIFARI